MTAKTKTSDNVQVASTEDTVKNATPNPTAMRKSFKQIRKTFDARLKDACKILMSDVPKWLELAAKAKNKDQLDRALTAFSGSMNGVRHFSDVQTALVCNMLQSLIEEKQAEFLKKQQEEVVKAQKKAERKKPKIDPELQKALNKMDEARAELVKVQAKIDAKAKKREEVEAFPALQKTYKNTIRRNVKQTKVLQGKATELQSTIDKINRKVARKDPKAAFPFPAANTLTTVA